jgi:anti-sigma factor RsiW
MSNGKTIEHWALHAYADGELEAHERADVESHLAHDPDARLLLESIRREKQALHAAFDPLLDETVPYALAAAARGRNQQRMNPWRALAASVVLLGLGLAGGWYGAFQSMPDALTIMSKRALVAHEVYANDGRHFVEVTAAESDHLQKWLSKRIGAAVAIPDLTAKGYTFLGGRLLAAEERPAGQLLFEDQNKNRVAVFVMLNPEHKDMPMQVTQRGNLWGCYWMDGKFGMAVTGDLPKDEMLAVAKEVYDQLERS